MAVHAVVGTAAIDTYLKMLRKNQLEEYHAAFEGKRRGRNVTRNNIKEEESKLEDVNVNGSNEINELIRKFPCG